MRHTSKNYDKFLGLSSEIRKTSKHLKDLEDLLEDLIAEDREKEL